ncbi:AbrB family transcriptional regulator [Rhodanobacter sp. C06]|uniref:AbrB/MazE/SpoVT family DNA-binding domain-containing protein n=1 Tax=Rhodanobacter sp. C06 TaxID=1945854 RepID=UPI0009867603|nr:AbrB/MazE/SpoVT family DNA-binding domain-containing protein [Rhodanobacter sp. C06]OOG37605.1 AbrB family transcriptional regulator [Rhodanobacter sp. C06]
MSTATLTSKGQVTIPAVVRSGLGVDTGDRIEFLEIAPGRYEVIAATLPVTALKGLVPKSARAVSVDAMNAAVRQRSAKTLAK